jgi:hypothetical protein
MKTLSESVMRVLTDLSATINLADDKYRPDLETMVSTNLAQEKKRRGKRSEDVIRRHTAMGLGAEIALVETKLFENYSPITEGAKGLTYIQRKRDLKCEGFNLEVKVMNARYNRWYISDSQCESVLSAANLNDFFLLVEYDELSGLKYRYRPRFLIDSSKVRNYIINSTGPYSNYMFDHSRASKQGACIDFKEKQYV